MPRTLEARRVNAYTISKLAGDAGISIHRVRQYEQRGLLRPCQCTDSGYHLASLSLPGVFPPATIGGCRHVDGGLANNVPLDKAVALGARTIYI